MDLEEKLLSDLGPGSSQVRAPALLARKLGASRQLVSHWITRRCTPTLHYGFAIKGFLEEEALRAKKNKTRQLRGV